MGREEKGAKRQRVVENGDEKTRAGRKIIKVSPRRGSNYEETR
jgi:hypothetical protein